MARFAHMYDKNGNYIGIKDARQLTHKDKELYNFICVGCGASVYLVCRQNFKHNRFASTKHKNENGKCNEDKSLKAITHYRDVEFDFEKMMRKKNRGEEKGPGPGRGKESGGETEIGPTEIGPIVDVIKPLFINNAKKMYNELSKCNLSEIRGKYVVGDIYVPSIEHYLTLKVKGEFLGYKMVLLVRCKPLKGVPNGYTCFCLQNYDEFSTRKVYFLIKLYEEYNLEFKRESISKDVTERKEYTCIAVLGKWERFNNMDDVYICKHELDLDCIHFVK